MTEERDWRQFGYGIIERICAATTIEKVDQLLTLHAENLEGYKAWNPEKHADLMVLIDETRNELAQARMRG